MLEVGMEVVSNIIGSAVRKINLREDNNSSCIKRISFIIHNDLFRYEDAKDFIAVQQTRDPKHRCYEVLAREGCLTERAAFYLRIHGCQITWFE